MATVVTLTLRVYESEDAEVIKQRLIEAVHNVEFHLGIDLGDHMKIDLQESPDES